jgi:hypothetical protein
MTTLPIKNLAQPTLQDIGFPTTWVNGEMSVDVNMLDNMTFGYSLATYDRTGGMCWEYESDTSFPTEPLARRAGVADAEHRLEYNWPDYSSLDDDEDIANGEFEKNG